ncbi:hypothetical protein LTR74_000066 [Friedmanniomyces endolithicus]|nr:hypothetical protein LTR74_000066 [Friedmanniomyces endolithicus]
MVKLSPLKVVCLGEENASNESNSIQPPRNLQITATTARSISLQAAINCDMLVLIALLMLATTLLVIDSPVYFHTLCALALLWCVAFPASRLPPIREHFLGQIMLCWMMLDPAIALLHFILHRRDISAYASPIHYGMYLALQIWDLLQSVQLIWLLSRHTIPIRWWIMRSNGAIIDALELLWHGFWFAINVRSVQQGLEGWTLLDI